VESKVCIEEVEWGWG